MKRFHALEKASTPCSCSRIRDTTSRKTSDDGQERFRLSNEACARILEETHEKTSGEGDNMKVKQLITRRERVRLPGHEGLNA